MNNNKYLVLYRDSLNFKCFADFATRDEARKYLEEISPMYNIIGIAELAKPIGY